jgi:protein-disulfide isomerase
MPDQLTSPVGDRDHIRGPASASLTLVEYGDFECEPCSAAHPIVASILEAFGERVRYVFRHFPLTSSHPNAQHAAEAAEWAATHDAFWPMYEALYGAHASLSDGRMAELAESIGLPRLELERAWEEHTFIGRVKEDFASGLESGVTGTPSFFINGVRHEGRWDEDALSRALEAACER